VGDAAPDFELATVDHSRFVRLSSESRSKPVVLIFGSYT
jgi:peroxiredoxin